eukprot:scaffold43478_cov63-Phaeocystis_antarctica.AAC.6
MRAGARAKVSTAGKARRAWSWGWRRSQAPTRASAWVSIGTSIERVVSFARRTPCSDRDRMAMVSLVRSHQMAATSMQTRISVLQSWRSPNRPRLPASGRALVEGKGAAPPRISSNTTCWRLRSTARCSEELSRCVRAESASAPASMSRWTACGACSASTRCTARKTGMLPDGSHPLGSAPCCSSHPICAASSMEPTSVDWSCGVRPQQLNAAARPAATSSAPASLCDVQASTPVQAEGVEAKSSARSCAVHEGGVGRAMGAGVGTATRKRTGRRRSPCTTSGSHRSSSSSCGTPSSEKKPCEKGDSEISSTSSSKGGSEVPSASSAGVPVLAE